jgi:hypothetical protein
MILTSIHSFIECSSDETCAWCGLRYDEWIRGDDECPGVARWWAGSGRPDAEEDVPLAA